MRKEMLQWVTPLSCPDTPQRAVCLPFPRRRTSSWLIPLFWDNVYSGDLLWVGTREAELPCQPSPVLSWPWHTEVLPVRLLWHLGLCCWNPQQILSLTSKNGKELNYFRDCREEGQGSFRAMGEEQDASREGWDQWCGLQPQAWDMEIFHNEKQMSHWHSGLG